VIGLLATAALKQGGAPAGPVLRAVLEGAEGAEKIEATKSALENIGKKVMALFGQGKGPVYGTRVHKKIADQIDHLDLDYLKAEQPLLPSGFKEVMQKGGIRLDVVLFDPENAGKVLAVFDFKTGSAKLTPKRIHQIKSFLPKGSEGARIVEIKL
jgi:hypothetical protein